MSDGYWESNATYANGDTTSVKTSEDARTVIRTQCGVVRTEHYDENHPLTDAKRLTAVATQMPSGLTQNTAFAYSDAFSGSTLLSTQTDVTTGTKTTQTFEDFSTYEKVVTTPEGRTTTLRFDSNGNLVEIVPEGRYPTTYAYDAQGRLTSSSTNNERNATYAYDAKGNLYSSTDALGRTTYYGYDVKDRLTSITYPDTHQSFFTYDANGNMKTLTTPTPGVNAWDYNGVNKATLWRSPLSRETLYTYDKRRRLTEIERPSGKTLTHAYANGQRIETNTTERNYDFTYACGNKLQSVQTTDGETIDYAYDGELPTGIAQSGTLNADINYTYNADFQPVSVAYAGGIETLIYDDDGLLIQSGSATIERNATTGQTRQTSDGIFTQTRTYNGFVETQSISDGIGGKNIYSYAITGRDSAGRITQKQERIGNRRYKYSYAYDDRGRLIESNTTSYKMIIIPYDDLVIPVTTNKTSRTEAYTYDANGNRLTKTINGTTTTATHTISDQLETLGSDTYAYDMDGYLASKITGEGTTHFSYGTLGELRSVVKPDGTVIEYVHNANNQRVAKKVNGTVTEKYLWKDLTTLLAIYDGNDNLITRFEYADIRMPYKMTHNGQTYYLSYDQVGSLRAVTAENGTIVKTIEYDTFGNVLSDSNATLEVPFGFAGGLYDPDTKLTRFGYRDYDAQTGKWTAKDPIGFDGGDTNLYGYVLGDPVNLVDPEGLLSGGGGIGGGFHFGIAGGNVHTQTVVKPDGIYMTITVCGRVGPGVYVGYGAEAGGSADYTYADPCENSPLNGFSIGIGADIAAGPAGGGGSVAVSNTSVSASGSGLFGSGIGISAGIEICYTYEIQLTAF